MTIEELTTRLGFEADLSGLKKYQSSLNTLEKNINNIKSDINIDTSKSVHNIEVLKTRIIQLAAVTGKTARGLARLGKFSAGVAGTVAKVAGGTIGAGIGASAVNAKSIAEVAKIAKGYETSYQYVLAIKQGLADISFDNVTDLMEEMRNKVQQSMNFLKDDLKSGRAAIEQFNIGGYTDANGKHQKAKKLEEGTLNDFFTQTLGNGDLAQVDSDFKEIKNTAEALAVLAKKSGEERFNIMLKLVDINKSYIASMDDFLSGESQRMMTQLLLRAKDAKMSVFDLVQKQKAESFIDEKDINNIMRYNGAMESLGRSIKGTFDRATAGVGEIIAPSIQQFADYIQAHKEQIRAYINEIVQMIKQKMTEIKESISTSDLFVNADGSVKSFKEIVSGVLGEIEERVRTFVTEVGAIMLGLSAIFLAGGPVGLAILGLSAIFAANFDKIKSIVSSSIDWVVKKVNFALSKIKELAGLDKAGRKKSAGDIGSDNHVTKPSNSFGSFGDPTKGLNPPKLPSVEPSHRIGAVSNNPTYNVSVNVAQTNAQPEHIADAVVGKLTDATSVKFNQTIANTPPIK